MISMFITRQSLASGINTMLANNTGYELRRVNSHNSETIHFLHIGKCAGNQIKYLARQINDKSSEDRITIHNHDVGLQDLNTNSKYFFSIRDPINRFISGFYSVRRGGRPGLNKILSPFDQVAFRDFEHANDLAENLFERDRIGVKALCAIKSIGHSAQNQIDWFVRRGTFFEIQAPVWIIRQEHFESDFGVFCKKANFGISMYDLDVARDPFTAHSFNYDDVPKLSPKAKENLRKWYVQDFEFYRICEDWMNNNL